MIHCIMMHRKLDINVTINNTSLMILYMLLPSPLFGMYVHIVGGIWGSMFLHF